MLFKQLLQDSLCVSKTCGLANLFPDPCHAFLLLLEPDGMCSLTSRHNDQTDLLRSESLLYWSVLHNLPQCARPTILVTVTSGLFPWPPKNQCSKVSTTCHVLHILPHCFKISCFPHSYFSSLQRLRTCLCIDTRQHVDEIHVAIPQMICLNLWAKEGQAWKPHSTRAPLKR